MIFCTKFDHLYLDKGLVLFRSLRRFVPEARLLVLALSEECGAFLKSLSLDGLLVVTLDDLLSRNPRLHDVRKDRDHSGFIFTLTPQVVLEAMSYARKGEQAIYLDADTMFFGSPTEVLRESEDFDVAITPHNFSAHMESQKRFGIYNVGWVGFKKSSGGARCARWWAESCLEWCHDRLENGKFADQKYLENFKNIADSVHVINHIGVNCAPWNVSGRRFEKSGDQVLVNGIPLVHYHFAKVQRISPSCLATRIKIQGVMGAKGINQYVYKAYAMALKVVSEKYSLPNEWIYKKSIKRIGAKYKGFEKDNDPRTSKILKCILTGEYVITGSQFFLELIKKTILRAESDDNQCKHQARPLNQEKLQIKLPTICLVTPSFNQSDYLTCTINSILDQQYEPLKYVVMDGGSTDGSREIIESLAGKLHAYRSERDNGQYNAINEGFLLSDGEIMGWLNSDDLHLPWTLAIVGEIFSIFPQIRWLTTGFPLVIDSQGMPSRCREIFGLSRHGILRGETLPGSKGFLLGGIQQESTFWRRDLWEQVGGKLDADICYAADFDLWMRFARHADIYSVAVPLACFRQHGDQKTSRDMPRYCAEAMESFKKHGKDFSNRRLRTFARQVLPQRFKPLAARLGWLYPAKIVKKNRDTGKWWVEEILA